MISKCMLRYLLVLAVSSNVAAFLRPSLSKNAAGHIGQSAPKQRSKNTITQTFLFNEQLFNEVDPSLRYFGEYIPLADDPVYGLAHEARDSRPRHDAGWLTVLIVPIVAPILAFMSYDLVAKAFEFVIETLSWDRSWVPVDGGAFQAKILTPAINGVVLPAIAVLFATLTSTTVVTLRARQVEIRKCLNMEAGELRALEYYIGSYHEENVKENCRQYLMQYCSRVIAESQPDYARSGIINPTRGMDSELYGILVSLTKLANSTDTPTLLVDQALQSLNRLRMARQDRITALYSTYPVLHYWILGILAGGECTGFLMEANQELLVFLNAIQLKILWSMLVATFTSCFTVYFDLLNPFSGGYQVSASVDQLYTIRQALKAESEYAEILQRKQQQHKQDDEDNAHTLLETKIEMNGAAKVNGFAKKNGKKETNKG